MSPAGNKLDSADLAAHPDGPMRKKPTQERARQTVAALLEATRQLLAERPLGGFTTDDVAARAGVSVGTLYQYFEDKSDLVRALGEAHLEEVTRAVASLRPPDERGPELLDYARALLRTMRDTHARVPRLHEALQEVGVQRALAEALSRSEASARASLERVAARLPGGARGTEGALAYDLVERFAHKRVAPGEAPDAVERMLDRYAVELVRALGGEG